MRQVEHWTLASAHLGELDRLASASGWQALERYLGIAVRGTLTQVAERLARHGASLRAQLDAAETAGELGRVRQELVAFQRRYLAAETVMDFFGDAINTRTSDGVAAYLRACDALARASMAAVLGPLGLPVPPVLTYLESGRGAAILKAGLRLWDGISINPVAAIRVVRHNLLRPTALIHETGHQVSHILGWSSELADRLRLGLAGAPPPLVEAWSGWASEIVGDVFGFVHTGYAFVASGHDVVAGDPSTVTTWYPGDPHPIAYLRVLLGCAMCVRCFGTGAGASAGWEELREAHVRLHPLERVPEPVRSLLDQSIPRLPQIAEIILFSRLRAFGGRSIVSLVDPTRVRPEALAELERLAGPALWTSEHWIRKESLRLLALTGLQAATEPHRMAPVLARQEEWMLRLGRSEVRA